MKTNRNSKINWKISLGAALGAAVLGSAGLSTRADDPKIAGPTTFVRVLHAVPGGSKVDVYIDGKKRLNDVTFGAITKYQRFPSGRHSFRIESNNPTRVVASGTSTLRSGDFYTLSTFGTPSYPRFLAIDDSAGGVPFGRARVTFTNFSPGLAPVDVVATTENGSTYRIARRLRYGTASAAALPAAPMTIRLMSGGRVVGTIYGVHPREGRKYAAYAIGRPGVNFRAIMDVTASQ